MIRDIVYSVKRVIRTWSKLKDLTDKKIFPRLNNNISLLNVRMPN